VKDKMEEWKIQNKMTDTITKIEKKMVNCFYAIVTLKKKKCFLLK